MSGIDTYFLVPFLLSSTFNGSVRVPPLIWSDSYPCTTLTGSSTPDMNRPSKKTLNLKINPNPRRGAGKRTLYEGGASRQRLSRRRRGCFFRAPARAGGCRGAAGPPLKSLTSGIKAARLASRVQKSRSTVQIVDCRPNHEPRMPAAPSGGHRPHFPHNSKLHSYLLSLCDLRIS